MSPLPTIRVSGSAAPDGGDASGKTGKLPTIRIGGLGASAAAPGKTSKIPPIVVPEPAAAPAEEVIDVVDVDVPAEDVIDIEKKYTINDAAFDNLESYKQII